MERTANMAAQIPEHPSIWTSLNEAWATVIAGAMGFLGWAIGFIHARMKDRKREEVAELARDLENEAVIKSLRAGNRALRRRQSRLEQEISEIRSSVRGDG